MLIEEIGRRVQGIQTKNKMMEVKKGLVQLQSKLDSLIGVIEFL